MTHLHKLAAALIILNILVSAACNPASESEDCARFQSGEFIFRNDKDGSITRVYRNGKIQTEVKDGLTDSMHFAMIWMKDCRYDLQYLGGSEAVVDSLAGDMKRIPIQVKILTTAKDYYTFSAQIEGTEFVLTDTLFKVK
jgi:hypothetical protein